MEMKLKGKGEVSWSEVNVIFAGVREMGRAREEVAILLNDVWHCAVVNMGLLALEFYGSNSSFQGFKFVWWWGMTPCRGGRKI